MEQTDKKKAALIITITLITVVLGVVAVATAMRLRQLATVPVAPNVPQSQPAAAEVTATPTIAPLVCTSEVTISTSACNSWCDDDEDCSGDNFCLIEAGEDSGVCRNPDCDEEDTCECAQATPTPSPTPPASCDQSCDVDADCDGDLICSEGSCRNPSCTSESSCSCSDPDPTPEPTTPLASCNQSCSDDTDCSGSNICNEGVCRNPSCTSESDCSCTTTTTTTNTTAPNPTTQPPQLPQAGSETPTLVLLGVGLLILVGGVVGLFML